MISLGSDVCSNCASLSPAFTRLPTSTLTFSTVPEVFQGSAAVCPGRTRPVALMVATKLPFWMAAVWYSITEALALCTFWKLR